MVHALVALNTNRVLTDLAARQMRASVFLSTIATIGSRGRRSIGNHLYMFIGDWVASV